MRWFLIRHRRIRRSTEEPVACAPMSPGEEAGSTLWPLSQISVKGLFGNRDFALVLDSDATVLTGENGSGKSTLLRAIRLLSTEQWTDFATLPLDRLELAFHDGGELAAEIQDGCLILSSGAEKWTFDLETASQVDPRLLLELQHARRDPAGQFRRQRLHRWPREPYLRHGGTAVEEIEALVPPEWLADMTDRFQTRLISARRLEHRLRPDPGSQGEETPTPVVEQYAEELRARMRDELSVYAAESRSQERNLPAQIVHAMQGASETSEGAEELADEVEQLRDSVRSLAASLASVGLFQEEDPDHFAGYPRDNKLILLAVREVYRVTKARLERLTAFRSDLELFNSFLNQRFSNKRIVLSQDRGIGVELPDRGFIAPSQLSSGEQQLLALAYVLLFKTDPTSVVLLDEPELSLHVAWLKGLLAAFLDIGQARRLQFVIATHSPSVLAGHTELERSLDLASE